MNPIRKILSSKVIWRLTGLTYTTSVMATHGHYLSRQDYLLAGKREMSILSPYFDNEKKALEFGCGPGKNLFGIADKINYGFGIDLNGLYIKLARKLSNKYGIKNLEFIKYDGIKFPDLNMVDTVFEKGVFERIPKSLVSYYVGQLKQKYLKDKGIMILYFLMERAKGTIFTQRLGDSAYVFWEDREIKELLEKNSLELMEILNIDFADYYICKSL